MKFIDPYRWLIGGVLVASLIGGFLFYRNSLIQEGVAREKAKVAEAVAEQKALAEAQTKNLQEVANEAQAQYIQYMAAARAAADRAAADLARLRGKSASAEQLARASKEALSEYAADAERSVDFCAERLSRTGETAGGASAAAHTLYAGWPAYQEFQDRMTTFTNQLKGKP
jgi:alanyl-tRNA synthetase